MIALTFVSNPENKKCVNHKNGIKTDNRAENLEWNTYSENRTHSIVTGLHDDRGERHTNSKLTEKDIIKMRNLRFVQGFKLKNIYPLYPQVHKDYITLVINKKRWTHIN